MFDEAALAELGCGGLLGVNAGSEEPPRMIKPDVSPGGVTRGHLALVGKGVTFDSGGLSLKPTDSMEDMKWTCRAPPSCSRRCDAPALGCRANVAGYLM